MSQAKAVITGRCYCGQCALTAYQSPQVVTYCHCSDCKRWTGAAAPVFAGFGTADLKIDGAGAGRAYLSGAHRWVCPECGSALAATFEYLPDQIYVPLGVLDQGETLDPTHHCHADAAWAWALHADGLPRSAASGREVLGAKR